MKRAILGLLKLLVQVVVFAMTGSWPEFDEREQPAPRRRTFEPQKRRERSRRRVAPSSTHERARRAYAPDEHAWTLETLEGEPLVGERLDVEPMVIEGAPRARARVRPKVLTLAPEPAAPRTLRAALRDRRTVREAIVLGTALAPPRRD